jgi:hypothetical protein
MGFMANAFASDGGMNATASGLVGSDTFGALQFNLILPTNGGWSLDFGQAADPNGNLAYYFIGGAFSATAPVLTPEPGTVGLMLTGIVGIAGVIKRKAKLRQ